MLCTEEQIVDSQGTKTLGGIFLMPFPESEINFSLMGPDQGSATITIQRAIFPISSAK